MGEAQNILEGGYYKALTADAFELAETDPFRLPALVKRVGETKYKKELLSLLRLIFRDALILKTSKINGVSDSGKTGKNRAEKYLMLKSDARDQRLLSPKRSAFGAGGAFGGRKANPLQRRFSAVSRNLHG